MKLRHFAAILAAAGFVAAAPVASAKPFKFANQGDMTTADPHGLFETTTLMMQGYVYEGLVRIGKDLEIEPALAESWKQTDPKTWVFSLRKGVAFHDGGAFTADDVVYSFARAKSEGSDLKTPVATVESVTKIDDHTVQIVTRSPNPILLREFPFLYMVSKSWIEKNNAADPVDVRKGKENYATRNANGTGPFMLKERQPGVKAVFVPNAKWWDKLESNITEATFTPIGNDATRVAALLSGDIDMMEPIPIQDVDRVKAAAGRKVMQGPELRTIFLGFDQERAELLESNVKGKNPFKDARVRKAFYQAIDIEGIRRTVMRGASTPAALMIGPGIAGFDAAQNQRFAHDADAAKKLLAEAGYPNGFEVGMDCPNDRYVNDERICLAVVPMLARIGITVKLHAQSKATYFPKILSRNTSFYLLGWTSSSYDAHNPLISIFATPDKSKGRGTFNLGGYSNARVDALTDMIQTETDQAKRGAMIKEAFQIHKDEVGHIPLHQQALAWGMKDNVDLVQRADNVMKLEWVKVK
jgi:peptide/nickel transport system substrate-binding protein